MGALQLFRSGGLSAVRLWWLNIHFFRVRNNSLHIVIRINLLSYALLIKRHCDVWFGRRCVGCDGNAISAHNRDRSLRRSWNEVKPQKVRKRDLLKGINYIRSKHLVN